MEMGVAAACIPVVERCGNQASDVQLNLASIAGSGKGCMVFDELEDIADSLVMGCDDLLLGTDIGGCPERRNRLDGREREIESGHGVSRPSSHLTPPDVLDFGLPLGLGQSWFEEANLVPSPF
ncbi:hypothetical protein JOF29_002782 [Kribbella aluminosa]|uniref:Uncharacterized protein n=1 Tax=Kribbella aluminosa TaxID=416017 RepID=A0ABS4UJJ0_9ACTN|nr:hypothetical protein [Kribbella aluminosa]